jgi:predicted nucleic acid-binding protein
MAIGAFLDTSVLLAGLVDFGPQSAPAQSLLHAVAEKQLTAATAWHCCLEFYSVATRMPPEFRLAPSDAVRLLEEEVFGRMAVHDLPAAGRLAMLKGAGHEGTTGGRIYDTHIAEVARAAARHSRRDAARISQKQEVERLLTLFIRAAARLLDRAALRGEPVRGMPRRRSASSPPRPSPSPSSHSDREA